MAAMILACGTKARKPRSAHVQSPEVGVSQGFRGSLSHATIMLNQPRTSAQGQATEIAIKAREAMSNRQLMLEILAEKTGQLPRAVPMNV
eukprot:tig00001420_g8698.t1